MAQQSPSTGGALAVLRDGEIVKSQTLFAGHNAAFLIDLRLDGTVCQAIYKPRAGETPLWDFPDGTLYRREYLAYRVSESLGWGIVPATVIRDGPHGIGSAQLFIDALPQVHYFTLLEKRRAALVPFALFDCLINNTDRKGGHILQSKGDGRLWGIDHGLSFHSEPKLRTVMWDLEDEAVPDELRPAIAQLCEEPGLRRELTSHLARQEVEAFYKRVEVVAQATTAPLKAFADGWRPYPWPPV